MRASAVVGRVGGLAVALGIGAGLAIGGAGESWAEPPDSAASADQEAAAESGAVRGSAARSSASRDSVRSRAERGGRGSVPAAAKRNGARRTPVGGPARSSLPKVAAATVVEPSRLDLGVSAPQGVSSREVSGPATVAVSAPVVAPAAVVPVAQASVMAASPKPAAARGVVESVWAPLLGTGPQAPVQTAVSWVVLAAVRRQLGAPAAATSASGVSTGQLVAPAATAPSANKPPVINALTLSVPNASTGVVTGTVKASDPNGDKMTYTAAIASPAKAAVTITTAGVFTYTPTATARHAAAKPGAPLAVTSDVVTVTVTDTKGAAVTRAVTVSVSPKNAAPTATASVGTPNAGTGVVTGTVTGRDGDGDALTYSAPATTAKGAVSINAGTGAFTYTPTVAARQNAARAGATSADKADSFSVTVTDGYGGSAVVPVNVVVSPAQLNRAPVAGKTVLGASDPSTGTVTGSVSASDPDGDALAYSLASPTPKGSVSVAANGSFTYTPTATARHAVARIGEMNPSVQTDNFTVGVSDGKGGTTSIPVIVGISPWNTAPTASVSASAPDASSGVVAGTVRGSDSDGDTLSYSAPASTAKGAVSINGSTGVFTYTPTLTARQLAWVAEPTGAARADSFTVTVTDGYGGSVALPVSVVVGALPPPPVPNRAPVAGTPSVGAPNPATGVVTGSVTATDPDGDTLSYSGSTTTSKGSVSVVANGGFTYTPSDAARHAAAKNGVAPALTADTFIVTAVDGKGGTATIPVTVSISPRNAVPTATATASAPDASSGVVTGTVHGSDGDGDSLTYSGPPVPAFPPLPGAPGNTGKGTVTVLADGSFTYAPTATAQRNASLPGSPADLVDTFVVTVNDGYLGGSISVPVTVAVNPLVGSYVAGDVRRDPVTGRIALRTSFPPQTTDPATGTPGYLNWYIATPSTGLLIGYPSDVQNWSNLYLVGSNSTPVPFNPAVTYPMGTVVRNPSTSAVAIRTMFPEDQGPNLAKMAWLAATVSSGGVNLPTSSVQTWDVLFVPIS